MQKRDRERQEEILRGRLAGLTYAQIGRQLGVSRQRVHQLIAPPTWIRDRVVKAHDGRCRGCGIVVNGSGHVHHTSCNGEDYNDIANLQLLCIPCHHRAHAKPYTIVMHSMTQIPEEKRTNIKRYWATHKSSYRKVGRMFRVSHTTVMNIVRAK